jgi:hypothetical protein
MFVLALGAGVVAGKLSARVSQSPATTDHPAASLTKALDLSNDQNAQMKHIWEHVRDVAHRCARERNSLKQEHEDKVVALLKDTQRAQYEQINKATNAESDAIDSAEKQAFDDAVKKTRGMLNDQQRLVYDQILKDRVGDSLSGIDSAGHGASGNSASQPAR